MSTSAIEKAAVAAAAEITPYSAPLLPPGSKDVQQRAAERCMSVTDFIQHETARAERWVNDTRARNAAIIAKHLATIPSPSQLTLKSFTGLLVSYRLVELSAVEDPEGYDNGATKAAIASLFAELAPANDGDVIEWLESVAAKAKTWKEGVHVHTGDQLFINPSNLRALYRAVQAGKYAVPIKANPHHALELFIQDKVEDPKNDGTYQLHLQHPEYIQLMELVDALAAVPHSGFLDANGLEITVGQKVMHGPFGPAEVISLSVDGVEIKFGDQPSEVVDGKELTRP